MTLSSNMSADYSKMINLTKQKELSKFLNSDFSLFITLKLSPVISKVSAILTNSKLLKDKTS